MVVSRYWRLVAETGKIIECLCVQPLHVASRNATTETDIIHAYEAGMPHLMRRKSLTCRLRHKKADRRLVAPHTPPRRSAGTEKRLDRRPGLLSEPRHVGRRPPPSQNTGRPTAWTLPHLQRTAGAPHPRELCTVARESTRNDLIWLSVRPSAVRAQ